MNIVIRSDHSTQSEQSDRSKESSQSSSSEHSSEASRTDPAESSETSSGDRRKANRGEMEPLVRKYIQQGLGAPEIVDRIYNVDRLLTSQGRKLEAQRIYVIKNKMKDKQSSAPSGRAKPDERKFKSTQSAHSDRSPRTASSQQREVAVRLEDSFQDVRDLPPRKREGRKEKRNYSKLNSTVDIELWKRFEAERERRRWTATDMMELILFNAFGHPTLSYAEPEVSEPERTKTGGKQAKKTSRRAKS
jgi:hypothetical protein